MKPRAKKVKKEMSENVGTLGKALKSSGYSKSYSESPNRFFNTKDGKQIKTEFLDWIDDECIAIQKEMKKKIGKAKYKELSDTLVNIKKLSQLLSGGATEREEVIISNEQLDEIIKRRKHKDTVIGEE